MSVPAVASKLFGPALRATWNLLAQEGALDAAFLNALIRAVSDSTPETPSGPTQEVLPELDGIELVAEPWINWAATVLADAVVDAGVGPWDEAADPSAALTADLEQAWDFLSRHNQDAFLSDERWRHLVAQRTVELLPEKIEAVLPGVGMAARMRNVLATTQQRMSHELLTEVADDVGQLVSNAEDRRQFDGRLSRLPKVVGERLGRLKDEDEGGAAVLARLLAESSPTAAVRSVLARPAFVAGAGAFAWLAVGDFASAHGMHAEAATAYEAAVDEGAPDGWRELVTAASVLIHGDLTRARQLLDRAASEGGEGAPFLEAISGLASDDPDQILRAAERVSRQDADFPVVVALRAQVLASRGDIDGGLAGLEEALAARPEATSIGLLAAGLYLTRAVSNEGRQRTHDLRRAQELALAATRERRRWGGPSGEALAVALTAFEAEGNWDAIKRFAVPGVSAVDGPDEPEVSHPDVQRAVLMAGLALGDKELAHATVASMTDEFERALSEGIIAWLLESDRGSALAKYQRASELVRDTQDRLRVEHARAAVGESPNSELELPAEEARDALMAMAEIADGRYQDAISRLRPLRNDSRSAARGLAEAYRASGDVESAVKTLDAAAQRFSDPSFGVLGTEIRFTADQFEDVVERARRLMPSVGESLTLRARLHRVAAEAAGRVGRWDDLVEHSRALIEIEPDAIAPRWGVVAGLAYQAKYDVAWSELSGIQGELPTSVGLAMVALELHRRHGHGVESVTYALRVAERFDAENVRAAALIAAYDVSRTIELSPELLARLHDATNAFLADFPESQLFRQLEAQSPDQLLQQLRVVLQKRRPDVDGIARDVVEGRVPYGVLAELAGRSYAEALVRRGVIVLPIEYDDDGIKALETESAKTSLGPNDVVVEPSVLLTAALLPDLWQAALYGAFQPAVLPTVSLHGLVRGAGSLALRSTASLSWDEESERPLLTEISSDEAEVLAQRADEMVREGQRLDPWSWQGFETLTSPPWDGPGLPPFAEWLAPLDVAVTHKWPLWSDDRALRAIARSEGIPTFGTLAVVRAMFESGHLSASDLSAAIQTLRRNLAVDLPVDADELIALVRTGHDSDFRAALAAIGRGPFWADLPRGFATYRSLAQSIGGDERRLGGLLISGLSGARAALTSDGASEVLAGLLIAVLTLPGVTASHIQHLMADLIRVLDQDEAAKTTKAAAKYLRNMWRNVVDEQQAARNTLTMFATCDAATRRSVLSGLLDVPG